MSAESDAVATLSTSAKPAELARAAQVLAASAQAANQKKLVEFLQSPAFQDRLDPASEPYTGPEDRWIAKPLQSLANNKAAPARATLEALMADRDFTADPDHVDLLITASARMIPPGPPVIAFWRKYNGTSSAWAMMDNGDPLAVAEFERLLLITPPPRDPRDGNARVEWLRGPFLKHRDNPAVLAMAQRMLAKAQPPNWNRDMQLAMAEALFLWDGQWYRPHRSVPPPALSATPAAGRQTLRAIGEQVRHDLKPGPALDAGIAATLQALDALSK